MAVVANEDDNGVDGALDTSPLVEQPWVLDPSETPAFSDLASNLQQGVPSSQGFDYDVSRAVGYYLADNSANEFALDPNGSYAQADLQLALGPGYAAQVSSALDAYANGQLQASQETVTATTATAGDPVNLGTGQAVVSTTDFVVAGAGIDFAFLRTYRSGAFYQGPLGWNWDHTANLWLYVLPDGSLMLHGGALQPVHYLRNSISSAESSIDGPGFYVASGDDCVVVPTIDGAFQRVAPNGTTTRFEALGVDGLTYQVTEIVDRFRNTVSFAYLPSDGGPVLSQITVNNPGRTVSFAYDDYNRISSITLVPVTAYWGATSELTQRVYTYSYDDYGDLISVTGPATDDFPGGCTTQYAYSSSSMVAARPHDLLAVTDPNGATYLENEFGTAVGSWNFGRVVAQRVGSGLFRFEWGQVLPDPSWSYPPEATPTSVVTVIQRNGHPVNHVLNALGTPLLSRETLTTPDGFADVLQRFAYDADGRQVASLSAEGRMTQYYFGRQYYYDSTYSGVTWQDLPAMWQDTQLTPAQHATFSNVLATVQRGNIFDFASLADDLSVYDAIFPPATTSSALGGTDVIRKYTYEPSFQQVRTSSDPRYTQNASPGVEGAAYVATLTTVAFNSDSAVTPSSVTFPDTTYPAPLPDGTDGVSGAKLTFDAYDASGRLLQTTDPSGVVTSFTYFSPSDGTAAGFVATRTVGAGALALTTTYTVDEAGQITSLTNPRGATTVYQRDGRGLVRVTIPPMVGYKTTNHYDGNGRLVAQESAIIAPDGTLTSGSPELLNITYNEEMSPIEVSWGDSSGVPLRSVQRIYDQSNMLTGIVWPRGNTVAYEYDERLLMSRTVRGSCSPEAAATSFTRDLDGNIISVTDPRGNTTTQLLDAVGRPIVTTDPIGTLSQVEYDQLGNPTVRRLIGLAEDGSHVLLRRSEMLYDARGQLIRTRAAVFPSPIAVADPSGEPDREYDAAVAAGLVAYADNLVYRNATMQPVLMVDANGNATATDYDPVGRPWTVTDPSGSTATLAYDPCGSVLRRDLACVDSDGNIQAVISSASEYDLLQRRTAAVDGAGNRSSYCIDSRGLILSASDALGNVTEYCYNAFRDRTAQARTLQLASGGSVNLTTRYQPDANSNIVAVTDELGNVTRMSYDTLDRCVRVVNADGSSRRTRFDRCGNPVLEIDEDGVRVDRTFDQRNLLVGTKARRSGPAAASADWHALYTLDGAGVMLTHTNEFVSTSRVCDSLGRCHTETITIQAPLGQGLPPLSINRQFDGAGNMTQLAYPSGQLIGFAYDGANRLITIESSANGTPYPGDPTASSARTLLQKGWWGDLPASAQLGNGLAYSAAFDAAARLIEQRLEFKSGMTHVIQQLWDGGGNRELAIEVTSSAADGWRYEYDSADRLTASYSVINPSAFYAAGFAPPTAPAPTLSPGSQPSIDAAAASYLSAAQATQAYSYDSAGNRTQASSGGVATIYATNTRNQYTSVGTQPLAYDSVGRLTSDGHYTYSYSFRGQLVQATAVAGGGPVLQVYHDALGRVVAVSEGGATRVLVSEGANAIESYDDGQLAAIQVAESPRRVCFVAEGGTDMYLTRDVLESTRVTTDGRGSLISTTAYDPFGLLATTPPVPSVGFAGMYYYASVGWFESGIRQYIPQLGRFAQPDPSGFVDGANLYTYVRNNPLSARDPSGMQQQDVAPGARITGTGAASTQALPEIGDDVLPRHVVTQGQPDGDDDGDLDRIPSVEVKTPEEAYAPGASDLAIPPGAPAPTTDGAPIPGIKPLLQMALGSTVAPGKPLWFWTKPEVTTWLSQPTVTNAAGQLKTALTNGQGVLASELTSGGSAALKGLGGAAGLFEAIWAQGIDLTTRTLKLGQALATGLSAANQGTALGNSFSSLGGWLGVYQYALDIRAKGYTVQNVTGFNSSFFKAVGNWARVADSLEGAAIAGGLEEFGVSAVGAGSGIGLVGLIIPAAIAFEAESSKLVQDWDQNVRDAMRSMAQQGW